MILRKLRNLQYNHKNSIFFHDFEIFLVLSLSLSCLLAREYVTTAPTHATMMKKMRALVVAVIETVKLGVS